MISSKKNKWLKYKYLKKSKSLARCLPKTRMLSEQAFSELLSKYKKIVLKPVGGSRGRGVFLVSSLGSHKYAIHYEKSKMSITGRANAYHFLKRHIGSADYMVQRCISRATVQGRPFDLRVIIQRRKKSSKWKVTGQVAKVAGSGYFVSNITRSGGNVLPVDTALGKSSIKHISARKIQSRIDWTAVKSAKRLHRYFKSHRIYGLDVGLDRKGRVWIIEANLFPARSHFRLLKSKSMLRRITKYKKG